MSIPKFRKNPLFYGLFYIKFALYEQSNHFFYILFVFYKTDSFGNPVWQDTLQYAILSEEWHVHEGSGN